MNIADFWGILPLRTECTIGLNLSGLRRIVEDRVNAVRSLLASRHLGASSLALALGGQGA
jgi:hypothetical protein